jgi:hypothetical protein
MTDKLTRRGFLGKAAAAAAVGFAATGFSSAAAAAVTFQNTNNGTNIKVKTSPQNEAYFARRKNAEILGRKFIDGERKRGSGTNYESMLERVARSVNGINSADAEEGRPNHLCFSGRADGEIEVRFTSIGGIDRNGKSAGGIDAISRKYGISKSDAKHAYKANLTAVIVAGGKTHRVTEHYEFFDKKKGAAVEARLQSAGVPLSGSPLRALNQNGCTLKP